MSGDLSDAAVICRGGVGGRGLLGVWGEGAKALWLACCPSVACASQL